MKDEAAVHPVGDKVACDVADVEVQVVVGAEKAAQPGDKGAVEGVDAAHDQEQEELPGEKMLFGVLDDVHGYVCPLLIFLYRCRNEMFSFQTVR